MTEAQLVQALGVFYNGGGSPGLRMNYVYTGSDGDLGIMARSGKVVRIVAMPHWKSDPKMNYAQQCQQMRSQVRVGMTLDQVWAAIGRPSSSSSSTEGNSSSDLLLYGLCRVHLRDDRVFAVD